MPIETLACLGRRFLDLPILGLFFVIIGILFVFRRRKWVSVLFSLCALVFLIVFGWYVIQIIVWRFQSFLYPSLGQIIAGVLLPITFPALSFLLMFFGKKYADKLRGNRWRIIPLILTIVGVITFIGVTFIIPTLALLINCVKPALPL